MSDEAWAICEACNGTGRRGPADPTVDCPRCKGDGRIRVRLVPLDDETPICPLCEGDEVAEAVALRDDIIQALSAGLQESIGLVKSWSSYADDYFQKKHDRAADIARLTAILATGKPGEDSEPEWLLRAINNVAIVRESYRVSQAYGDTRNRMMSRLAETLCQHVAQQEARMIELATACVACGRQHLATDECDPWAVAYRANIPAADVPEWAVHVATDEEGEAYVYDREPSLRTFSFGSIAPGLAIQFLRVIDPLPGDWRGSLRRVDDVWPERKQNQGKDGGE